MFLPIEFVTSLHVGEVNIRVGYVPFNTDVYQSFDMDMYDDVESVIQGIGGYISSRPGGLIQLNTAAILVSH